MSNSPETNLAAASVVIGVLGCALVVSGLGGPTKPLAQLALGIIFVVSAFSLFALAWKNKP